MSGEQFAPGAGVVYTETVVHSAPERYVAEAPYQIAIIALDSGRRLTARILGERVGVDDRVEFIEFRSDVPCFRKAGGETR